MDRSSLETLARAFADRLPGTHERLFLPLIQLLAQGHPVSPEQLATAVQMRREEVLESLAHLPDTEFDENGNIVGWGLTLIPTPHQFQVNGQAMFTWCALDALTFPTLLQLPAQVESPCRVTGRKVTLSVTRRGIENLEPASAVVSLMIPTSEQSDECIRGRFCHQMHFFSSRQAAETWQTAHQEAVILSVEDAYQVGQMLAASLQRSAAHDGSKGE